jgi:Tol biopolymer transport system component
VRASLSKRSRLRFPSLLYAVALILSLTGFVRSQTDAKKDDKKKKPEPFKIQQLSQGMGLYAIGAISPDRQSILLLAHRPDESPNLYVMKLVDHSIRPPLTSFKLGITDAQWSPDGSSVAFAVFSESVSFPEIYTLELKTGKLLRLTSNSFSDKEPLYAPDGKRLLFTSDESPLPDAAFGTLHIASVAVTGGKPEAFTEDDCSSIHPGLSSDGKSVLLVKVDEHTGRHSLWQYGFDGKPQRDLTERKFARIHRFIYGAGGSLVLWAQEEPEQQDGIYIMKSGEVQPLPDPDLPKRTPAVSPDGKLIAFIAPTVTGSQLFVFDSASGEIKQITYKPGGAHSPMFVSNSEILFGSDREKGNEIFSVDLTRAATDEKKKK